MRTKKLASLAAVAALTTLMISSGARADLVTPTVYAGGILLDGTGAAAGSANVTVTVPDGEDEGTLPDPVPGVLVRYFAGDTEVPCLVEFATTDPNGVARCGLLGHMVEVLEGGGYTAKVEATDVLAAAEDHGSLIHEQGQELP